jgi:hypothetical protein
MNPVHHDPEPSGPMVEMRTFNRLTWSFCTTWISTDNVRRSTLATGVQFPNAFSDPIELSGSGKHEIVVIKKLDFSFFLLTVWVVNLVPSFKVPCSKNFLFWYYCLLVPKIQVDHCVSWILLHHPRGGVFLLQVIVKSMTQSQHKNSYEFFRSYFFFCPSHPFFFDWSNHPNEI